MKINIREKEGVAILDLEGNIDINASNFVETIGWVLNNKTKKIICNFEGVNLVDYVGISLIAVIYKNILNHQGKISIYNVPAHVRKLFSITGLDRIFEYNFTEEQALNELKAVAEISQLLKKKLRRRFKRIPSKIIIQYKPKSSKGISFHRGEIVNLSAEGVFVITKEPYPAGDLLLIRINLMPKPGIIETEAKVVWIADKDIQFDYSPGMGLEFYNLTPQKQKKIINFIERHITHSAQN